MTAMLAKLRQGSAGEILRVDFEGAAKKKLADVGFSEGETVMCMKRGPQSGPSVFVVKGAAFCIRRATQEKIYVKILS